MKTLLTLCLLLVALCADAAFYQYNRYSTNFDTTLVDGGNLTNISGTNLVVSTVNSNKFDPATLALFAAVGGPTVNASNFVSGVAYTNTSGKTEFVSVQVNLTLAAVVGGGLMELVVDNAGGINFDVFNATSEIGLATSAVFIPTTLNGSLNGFIPAGASYVFTNLSSGAGNISTIVGRRTLTQF